MTARRYVSSENFTTPSDDFTFETIDDQLYFKIGSLNTDDQFLVQSLISGNYIGFFINDIRQAIARITGKYHSTNGTPVQRIPSLTLNQNYVIKFTQARPGRDGEGSDTDGGTDGADAQVECATVTEIIRTFKQKTAFNSNVDADEAFVFVDSQNLIIGHGDSELDFRNLPIGTHVRVTQGETVHLLEIDSLEDPQDYSDATEFDISNVEESGEYTNDVTCDIEIWVFGDAEDNTHVRFGVGDPVVWGEWKRIKGRDGQDGEDVPEDHTHTLTVNTRGELIATTSFLPEDPPDRNLRDDISWTLNLDSEFTPLSQTAQGSGLFTVNATHAGELTIPYDLTSTKVNGIWVVTEDLADNDTEPYQVFIPWGFGNVDRDNTNEWIWRYVIHFGVSDDDTENRAEDVYVIITKRKTYNHKAELAIVTTGDRDLPSNQCRVKVYLAGVFISESTDD